MSGSGDPIGRRAVAARILAGGLGACCLVLAGGEARAQSWDRSGAGGFDGRAYADAPAIQVFLERAEDGESWALPSGRTVTIAGTDHDGRRPCRTFVLSDRRGTQSTGVGCREGQEHWVLEPDGAPAPVHARRGFDRMAPSPEMPQGLVPHGLAPHGLAPHGVGTAPPEFATRATGFGTPGFAMPGSRLGAPQFPARAIDFGVAAPDPAVAPPPGSDVACLWGAGRGASGGCPR